jgi:hypothetical protein
MTNLEKYNSSFMDTFGISSDCLPGLKYNDVPDWDSVGHMALMTTLEDCFIVEIEIDDIIEFSGYEIGKSILLKYGVKI